MRFGYIEARHDNVRRLRARAVSCAAAAVTTLLALAMSSGSAEADIVSVQCGMPLRSTVKAFGNATLTVTSNSFVNVAGAAVTVNVPDAETRCVRVKFYVSAECTLTNPASDHLFFRVTDNGSNALFFPASTAFTSVNRQAANAFEWAVPLAAGAHVIRMQTMVSTGTCSVYQWVMAVDVAE
jgi:hypothetical protein